MLRGKNYNLTHTSFVSSKHFLFGDLDATLRDEIIDAFQDVRIDLGMDIIKQGDAGDNFYVIVSKIVHNL